MLDSGLSRPAEAQSGQKDVLHMPRAGGAYANGLKRVLDCLLIAAALPVLLPVIFAAVVCIGRSPFYTQTRIGRGGREFKLWKLRTMVCEADAELARYLAKSPELKREWDLHQKLDKDPRITRFGAVLRKTSLDELPQLWNVLIGDMSLVGPRPMMASQKKLYPGKAYYRLRPGLTGPWQVSSRNNVSFSSRASFDEAYERDLSLRHDLGLILKTLKVVVYATGK